jgi:hypothetical protein
MLERFRFARQQPPSFRGALLREPGIHDHRGEYGFRACASGRLRRLKAHPGMTNVWIRALICPIFPLNMTDQSVILYS